MPKLDRSALRGRAQTVLGVVDPAELGPTLMHEHLICDITPPKLVARGVDGPETEIDTIMVQTPKRLLTFV